MESKNDVKKLEFITSKQVAEQLGVSEPTVYSYVQIKLLKALVIPVGDHYKSYKFTQEWVDEFIKKYTAI